MVMNACCRVVQWSAGICRSGVLESFPSAAAAAAADSSSRSSASSTLFSNTISSLSPFPSSRSRVSATRSLLAAPAATSEARLSTGSAWKPFRSHATSSHTIDNNAHVARPGRRSAICDRRRRVRVTSRGSFRLCSSCHRHVFDGRGDGASLGVRGSASPRRHCAPSLLSWRVPACDTWRKSIPFGRLFPSKSCNQRTASTTVSRRSRCCFRTPVPCGLHSLGVTFKEAESGFVDYKATCKGKRRAGGGGGGGGGGRRRRRRRSVRGGARQSSNKDNDDGSGSGRAVVSVMAMAGGDGESNVVVPEDEKPAAALRPHERKAPHLMIVSDLDHTMVDHSDKSNSSLVSFNALWTAKYASDGLLVYSTGRSPTKYAELRSEVPLLTPGITILAVGTLIGYGETMDPDLEWLKILDEGWNRDVIVEEAKKFPVLKFQDGSEQRQHKVSFWVNKEHAPGVMGELSKRLKERGVKAKLIFSGSIDLDVLPVAAGKGQALAYLLKKMRANGCQPGNTLVCGDSGNDAELFEVEGVNGVVVSNAMEELVKWYEEHPSPSIYKATKRCAGGIMEAIQHFGFHPSESDSPRHHDHDEKPQQDSQ